MRYMNLAREAVCILALLCVAVVLSPFWLAVMVWQHHEWQKQVRGDA